MKPSSRTCRLPVLLLAALAIWAPHLVRLARAKPPEQPQQNPQVDRASQANQPNQPKPEIKSKLNERTNLVEADENGLYLVGLFDVHHSNPRVPFKCGPIDADAGEWQSRRPMQNMEAFLWAIEQVNADKSLLPGVQLGSLIMDTCSSFLRTNQQAANLLHGQMPQAPGVRQIAGIVVDAADAHSVDAVSSMASALGLASFVTQSRSTLLSELARKYRLGQPALELSSLTALHSMAGAPPSRLLSINADLAAELERRSALASTEQQFEGLLGELLGIGKMTTPAPASTNGSAPADSTEPDQPQKLLMVRMLLGNELIADSIAAFVQQMNWDFVSVVYDDELDMIDLHDELLRKLFARNTQLALDEQVALGSSAEIYDRLLQSLAKKSALGAKVVITLLGTGSSRALLDSLRHLRRSPASNANQVEEVNSLLWVTVADREPYYSFATDALGTIAISSSVSLLPDFKNHYDRLENVAERRKSASGVLRASANKWWPEYVKAVLQRHQKDIELVSNECAKWQEPKASPLRERCRALTLQSLVQTEKQVAISGNGSSAKSPYTPIRLAKYLAGGWEHNGMDVINSVLAAANGLESIRQALCPDTQSGLCERMRELIGPVQSGTSASAATHVDQQVAEAASAGRQQQLPLLSELMYNELLRSTFQLADGRMFNLNEFDAQTGGGQVEGKLKLYNLRYLQPNSIGFVKFGTYDQQDGLLLNASKAMHYPNNSYLNQLPIERVKSSCRDESKCLMLAAYEGAMNKQPISEEELALGVNSLFKLDHPMIMSSSSSAGSIAAFDSSDLATAQLGLGQTGKRQTIEDSHVHTMRSAPGISQHFNRTTTATTKPADQELGGKQTFNTIVLLPLHGRGHQSSSSAAASASELAKLQASCSDQLDIKHSFQYLVALAYAQNLANTQHNPFPDAAASRSVGPKIELTTTVIDYCEQLEWAKTKLAAKLGAGAASERQQEDSVRAGRQQVEKWPKQVAVIDFDTQIGEHIADLTSDRQLLHLTISAPSSSRPAQLNGRQTVTTAAGKRANKHQHGHRQSSSSANNRQEQANDDHYDDDQQDHLRVSLLPSKSSEIQAIVRLLSSMSQWKLVHLIYTDHHHYRDEFVRRANEANICVSKLIWIPSISAGEVADQAEPSVGSSNDSLNTKEAQQLNVQVEKTKRLFARELHDYSNSVAPSSTRNGNAPDGLNSTRVLVVLASSSESTNQLILEAASQSMLDDYVWITSHEWLSSVELPAELAEATTNDGFVGPSLAPAPSETNNQQVRLPKYFISTRLETFESASFRHYFASLSPSIHAPIPTAWFDEFWQQHFQCRLPIVGSSSPTSVAARPLCESHQHLDLNHIIEDDRVHYIIMAIQAIHEALHAQQQRQPNASTHAEGGFSRRKFAAHFRRSFERLTSGQSGSSPLGRLPYGFHFVHRVLPSGEGSSDGNQRRRENSRDLSGVRAPGQLLKVGLWRNGELALMRKATNESSNLFRSLNSAAKSDQAGGDAEITLRVAASLSCLSQIRSRCSLATTCSLCRQQVEQSKAAAKLEEALYGQSQSVDEPNAISSIWANLQEQQHKQQSILDTVASTALESADKDEEGEDEPSDNRLDRESVIERRQREGDNIEASAASLFDAGTKRLVEERRQSDVRRAYTHQAQQQTGARWMVASQPLGGSSFRQSAGIAMSILSLLGIVCMVASMTHLYPRMLRRKEESCAHPDRSHRPAAPSSNLLRATNNKPELSAMRADSLASDAGNNQPTLANINDYFLLTGLLMLCSINIALLLPATKSVCWFRRIGLATSYTVIFSSILVKVLASCRQSTFGRARRKKPRHQSSGPSSVGQPTKADQQQQQQVDPVDENVELTFESLPPDQGIINNNQEPSQQTSGPSTVSEQLSNAYQTRPANDEPSSEGDLWHYANQAYSNSNLMSISMGLILVQLAVSLIWLVQQPPEPTLYFACWRCASPIRSPNLFLYEPLLSLLYAALVLLAAWIWSIAAFRRASRDEEQYRAAAAGRLKAASNDTGASRFKQLEAGQHELDYRLRDAKSLVMTTTLLILIWSLFTLNMISTSQRQLLPSVVAGTGSQQQQNHQQQQAVYSISRFESANKLLDGDLTLVYANLISGAIIFSFLFVYRLHLFSYSSITCPPSSCLKYKRSKSARTLIYDGSLDNLSSSFVHSYGSYRGVLKFNQPPDMRHCSAASSKAFNNGSGGSSDKWLTDCDDDIYPVARRFPGDCSLFSGELSGGSAANERLRLQQFNTYGTYSSGAPSAAGEHYRTSTTMNPLSSFQSIANSLSAATSGGSKRARKLIGTMAGKQETTGANSQQQVAGEEDEQEAKYRSALEKATRRQRSRAHSILFFGSSLNNANDQPNQSSIGKRIAADLIQRKRPGESKLQRRQSAGSVASSNAKLVPASDGNSMLDNDDAFMDDTISCASSVASSSTSQLHGNDLYPIDCSIQLDLQLPSSSINESGQQASSSAGPTKFGRSDAFERRSLRRSMTGNKELSAVLEEQSLDATTGGDHMKTIREQVQ